MRQKKNQSGFIVTIELLVLATVLVLGLIVGMVDVRDAVLAELSDVSESVGNLNQSYQIYGVQNAALTAATTGSQWKDARDLTGSGSPIDADQLGVGNSGSGGDVNFVVPANFSETNYLNN